MSQWTPRRGMGVIAACVLAAATAGELRGEEPAEPLLRGLTPNVIVRESTLIDARNTAIIGDRLGGRIERMTHSVLSVHSQWMKIIVMTAADDASAAAIHASLRKLKPHPFCQRKERLVIEYVGQNLDPSTAFVASYEIGLLPKPRRVTYRVTAKVAAIDEADYMAGQRLFSAFLTLGPEPDAPAIRNIEQLAARFQFGRRIVLRNPIHDDDAGAIQFDPAPAGIDRAGDMTTYSFDDPPRRHGVPYVKATIHLTVDDTGLRPTTAKPSEALTAATTFWPADDPDIKALAAKITRGKTTHADKAAAIIDWLTLDKNVRYGGQAGSRWGTRKALEQGFGQCWDLSDCFVTLCRAAGVPSRQVAGWLYGASGHVWAEYHREGEGWRQVDPTGGSAMPCGIYHIPWFTTEDGRMPIVYVAMPRIEVAPPR